MLNNLRRNVTYLKDYDEKSFIGLWIDYGLWSDIEYWKLEEDLLNVINYKDNEFYISDNVLNYVMRIVQLMIVHNLEEFSILDKDKKYTLNDSWGEPDIFDRYERFKYIVGIIFEKNRDLRNIDFSYQLLE